MALVKAHIELFKAELAEILSLVKTISILAGIILVIALFTGNLVYVGTWLFLGQWLFGSLGWGVVHGLLFAVGLIVLLVLAILGAGAGRAATAFWGLCWGPGSCPRRPTRSSPARRSRHSA
jgi:hypothetical protein